MLTRNLIVRQVFADSVAFLQVGKTQSDDPEEEKKQKEFKSLLNKITPDTFERILAKVKDVEISEHKTLEGLINQVCFAVQSCLESSALRKCQRNAGSARHD